MNAKTCESCGSLFEGRANKRYCSSRCQSTTNNQRVAERDEIARTFEREIRTNRRILITLYRLFGDKELPEFVIRNSGFKWVLTMA